MKTKKIGDWDKAVKAAMEVKSLMEKEKEKVLAEFAEKGLELLKGHIDAQDLPWRPLSDAYLEQKAEEGSALETWVRSQNLYDSLAAITKKGMSFAGVPEGEQTTDGKKMTAIAMIHEFGALSVGIYERPLFRPTMEEMKTWIGQQKPAENVKNELNNL
jgi:hypothetical protein